METGGTWAAPPPPARPQLGIAGTGTSPPGWAGDSGGTWARHGVRGAGSGLAGSRLAAAPWLLSAPDDALSVPGAVVWALAVLSLPFLLLLTPARLFPATRGRILTTVTMSPCKTWGLQDPNAWRRWLGCRGRSWDAGAGEEGPHLRPCLSFLTPTAPYNHSPSQSYPPAGTRLGVAVTGRFGVKTPPFGSCALPARCGAGSQAKQRFLTYFSLSFAAKKFIFHGRWKRVAAVAERRRVPRYGPADGAGSDAIFGSQALSSLSPTGSGDAPGPPKSRLQGCSGTSPAAFLVLQQPGCQRQGV